MENTQSKTELTLHMIGHGHIDPTWLWRWTEGYEEVRATFRSALDRMRESPDFKFTASSACFYAWFKEAEPALYEEMKQRIAEGRWEIAGGWWLEPDCNVPCGESFVRQGLYGLRFFQQEFGVHVKVGFNPDSFGHAATFPQILKKLGQEYYAFMRPMARVEKDYPDGDTFWWESADGSRVLTHNIHESYNTIPNERGGNETELEERFARALNYPGQNPAQGQVLFFFGVGNHGGGPTKKAIAWINGKHRAGGPVKVLFSTLQRYFEHFSGATPSACVPSMRGELQHHARGCYSIHHAVKKLNRDTEHALMAAERLASAAWLEGLLTYPKEQLAQAWKDLLYNQFHDILAGTSLPSSYADTRDQVGAARHVANTIINRVVQSVAREIHTGGPEYTVVVFNPLAWPVTAPVEVSENIERGPEDPAFVEHKRARIYGVDGVEIPSQVVTGERVGGRRYAFLADVPALGYRCYRTKSLVLGDASPRARSQAQLNISQTALENAYWRLEIDPFHGGIARLLDKRANVEVLHQGAILSAVADGSDTWGHGVKEWRAERGRFGAASLSIAESGEVLGRVRATTHFGASHAITDYTLYRDCDLIDASVRVNWQEAYTLLKWVFDTRLVASRHIAECAYGHAERKPGSGEEPCQQWITLAGNIAGAAPYEFSILNDGVFGYDASASQVRLTLLRSPAYAHHDPCIYEAHKGHELLDQGWHTFRFRIRAGAPARDSATRAAWELNVPPIAHLESGHGGARPLDASLVSLDAPHVALAVVKQSEDGEDIIVRAQETAGQASSGELKLHDRFFALSFTPHEIKTVRINPKTGSLRECNLLEE